MLNFKSILDLIRAFPDEQTCINYLEQLRWKDGVVSPFDSTSKVYKCKDNKYRCKNTGKYFNVRTNTIFEGSKISLQNWFMAIYLYTSHKRGISSYQLGRDLDVTQKTAWFILQRLRYATEHEAFIKEFEGVVQCDETFVGGKNKNRHKDKKVPHSQGRSFKDKVPVFGAIEQSTGFVKAIAVTDTKAKTIQPLLHEHIKHGSHVMTDEWHAYKGIGKYFNHTFVDHAKKQYVDEGTTTNAMECFWSHLKRSIIGVYYATSKKHLQLYLNEMTFRYNTKQMRTDRRFDMFLEKTEEKRLTWQSLTTKENEGKSIKGT
ncbi:IS1595 family transposase [Elizabethkingia ursingii]|uniref:IS1595 family transposase n=1 Tax=Elizabethkingia ursingii TaxID=1756150 RepID=UPI0020116BB7|nr:IS1595 family transposase [Elizabethkingia ursingii]MCL1668978.1 IS1595 family transposase [Elizabethkingia ursingii]